MHRWIIFGGIVAAATLFYVLIAVGLTAPAAMTAAVTLLCALWWIFEPVPIPFTSLLPLALFPLLGILDGAQIAEAYGNPLVLLLLGGYMLSEAVADSGAHKRLALRLVKLFGGQSARALVLGFMTTAALLSMWISNSATALMLLPVALAVLAHTDTRLAVPLLLGVAYGASIGGLGTPIGTPPNLIFMQVYAGQFGTAPSFMEWMSWGIPVVVLMVPLTALWLTRGVRLQRPVELPPVGRWQPAERRVMVIFALTALAWITRAAPFGGWSAWLGLPQANDASVALLAVVFLALLPDGKGQRLLRWESAVRIPWGVLILFGGGIAIANAFVQTGLADAIAEQLGILSRVPAWVAIIGICLFVTFLTEVTSNTAVASLLMPLMAAAAVSMNLDPRLLMVPAALSASCAFMLPVATVPNAVIYGSHRVSIRQMVQAGFVVNLIGVAVISLVCWVALT